jgi:hypothetical protein
MNRRSFLSWFGFAAAAAPVIGPSILASATPAMTDADFRFFRAHMVPDVKLGTTIRIRLPNDYVINESAFLLDNRYNGSRTTARTIWLLDQSA